MSRHTRSNPDPVAAVKHSESNMSDSEDEATCITLAHSIASMMKEIRGMRAEVSDMSKKLDYSLRESEAQKDTVNKLEKEVSGVQEQVSHSKDEITTLKHENKSLREKLIQMDCKSRRDNLIFTGIVQSTSEDCFTVIRKVLGGNMKIENAQVIKLNRCYRINVGKSPYPIMCIFNCSVDRELVWKARSQLAGSGIIVKEDFPDEIVRRRNSLYPIMKQAKDLGRTAFLVVDKLKIDGQIYTVDNLDALPADLDPAKIATKKYNDVVAFFSAASPLSNFHSAEFTIDGKKYPHVEQYLQYHKAVFADKPEIATKIRSTMSPVACKHLGDKIQLDPKSWIPHAQTVVMKACHAKFEQNERCKQFLIATGTATLAEASFDKYWGVGRKLTDSSIGDISKNQGENLLGNILQSVREKLSST